MVDPLFNDATFQSYADFAYATFRRPAAFHGADARPRHLRRRARFSGGAGFIGATFQGRTDFLTATFGDADFRGATFTDDADFGGATFQRGNFLDATFAGGAGFSGATFQDHATFRGATFTRHADPAVVTFTGVADFADATFSDADFAQATAERARSAFGLCFIFSKVTRAVFTSRSPFK